MKKIIKSISLLIVAGLGIYLNTYYYIFAFLNAGYGYISYVLSIFLKNKLKWVILKVALLAFSISMTLGAQFLSTSINEITTNNLDVIKKEVMK